MCGITGYISWSKNSAAQTHLLERMLSAIAHRGPDGQGFCTYSQVGMAHARLKILDLSDKAQQPFVGTSSKHILVYNGEIYNHLAIRQKLRFQNFETHSDTETLFYALQEYGEAIIPELNGIFSFVFVDLENLKALVARDRYGVKPLYYYLDKDGFYFASEIKALLLVPTLSKEIDSEALDEHIALLGSQNDKTPFKHIKKLAPAQCLHINGHEASVSQQTFWALPKQRSYIKDSPEKIIQNTEDLLVAAVKKQLMSDVPVGFFLSGGLDSSLLVALAQKHAGIRKPQCYTLKQDTVSRGFDNDYPYAQSLAQSQGWGLQLVEKPKLDLPVLDHILEVIQSPILDLSALNVEAIALEAQKQNTKVLISGLGADDVFTGYRRHVLAKMHGYLKYLPLGLVASSKGFFPEHSNARRWLQKLSEAWHSDPDVFLARLHLYSARVYLRDARANSSEQLLVSHLKSFDLGTDAIDKALALELYSYLPSQNLLYTDMASMKHGVEVRVPYLDNELTDYLYHIPPKLKMRGLQTKYILREIARNYLPKEIINRKKVGFSEVLSNSLAILMQEKIKDKFQNLHAADFTDNPQLLLNLYAVSWFMARDWNKCTP